MSDTDKEIYDLLAKIDSSKIEDLDKEQINKLRENILDVRNTANPYSSEVTSDENDLLLFMFTPMAKDYMIKLVTTSMIGYLFRANDEKDVPDGVPVVSVYDYIKDESLLDDPEPVNKNTPVSKDMLEDYAKARSLMPGKIAVAEFLESLFQYNPDNHVRSSYTPNKKDPERKVIVTPSSKLAVYMRKKELEKEKKKMTLGRKEMIDEAEDKKNHVFSSTDTIEKSEIKEVICKIRSKDGTGFKLVKRKVRCTKAEYDKYMEDKEKKWDAVKEKKYVTNHQDDMLKENAQELVPMKRCKDITLHETVRNILPPADLFHKFAYYMESNYEEIIDAVKDIYCEKPDIDYAINPLDFVKNKDEARKYRRKVEGEIKWPILAVNKKRWNLFGPYKENRKRLDFYGSNMALFEEMFKEKERERDIGAKLMKNKKKRKRRENRKKEGDVPLGVSEAGNVVSNLGKYKSQNDNNDNDSSDDEVSDEEEHVKVQVTRMSQGGRKVTTTEFETSYDAEYTRIG